MLAMVTIENCMVQNGCPQNGVGNLGKERAAVGRVGVDSELGNWAGWSFWAVGHLGRLEFAGSWAVGQVGFMGIWAVGQVGGRRKLGSWASCNLWEVGQFGRLQFVGSWAAGQVGVYGKLGSWAG